MVAVVLLIAGKTIYGRWGSGLERRSFPRARHRCHLKKKRRALGPPFH